MVWIDRDIYMAGFLHGKWFKLIRNTNDRWSELIRIFTWQMVKFIRNFTRQMVQINQELLWGKRSELIMNIFSAKVWIEQEFAQSKWSELFMNFYRAKVLNLSWISTEKKGVIWSSVSIGQTVWIDHEFL